MAADFPLALKKQVLDEERQQNTIAKLTAITVTMKLSITKMSTADSQLVEAC